MASWYQFGNGVAPSTTASKKHYTKTGVSASATIAGEIGVNGTSQGAYYYFTGGDVTLKAPSRVSQGNSWINAGTTFTQNVPLSSWITFQIYVDSYVNTNATVSASYVYGTKATPSVSCSFKGGYVRPDQSKALTFASNYVANIDEQYTIKSGVFYYKLTSASSYSSESFTGSTFTLPANTLTTGNTYNAYAVITMDDDTTVNVTFNDISTVDAVPSVSLISPINEVVYGTATFMWNYSVSTGTPQKAVDLQTSSDGSTWDDLLNYEETTATSYTSDIATSGTVYWRARGYNQDNVASEWSEAASFINNIPPDAPTITSVTATGRPSITWAAEDQIAYQVQILLDGEVIEDSGAVYSSESSFISAEYLEDNTYTIRVRVYNQFGKISEWAEADCTISGGTTAPTFTATSTDNGAMIQITAETGMTYYVKRNGVLIGKATEGLYVDRFASGETTYTVVAVDSLGNAAMASQTIDVEVKGNMLITEAGEVFEVNHRLGSPVGVSKQVNAVFDTAEFIGASTPEHVFAKMRETRYSVVFKDYVDAESLLGQTVFYADMYGNGDWCAVVSVGRVESRYGNETTAELQVTRHTETAVYD